MIYQRWHNLKAAAGDSEHLRLPSLLLVGNYHITVGLSRLQSVRDMITSHGKSYIIVLMSEIFPDKLRLFTQVDA